MMCGNAVQYFTDGAPTRNDLTLGATLRYNLFNRCSDNGTHNNPGLTMKAGDEHGIVFYGAATVDYDLWLYFKSH